MLCVYIAKNVYIVAATRRGKAGDSGGPISPSGVLYNAACGACMALPVSLYYQHIERPAHAVI